MLNRLTRNPTQPIPPGIKRDVLAYYSDQDAPITTEKNADAWKRVHDDLKILSTMPTSTEPTPYPNYGEVNQAEEQ